MKLAQRSFPALVALTLSIAACSLLPVLAVSTVAVSAEPPRFEKDFDHADALQGLTVSGDVSIDTSKDRGGAQGLEAAGVTLAAQKQAGAVRMGPGGKAVWPLRENDGTGVLELWEFNWNQSKLRGFVSVVLFGEATEG